MDLGGIIQKAKSAGKKTLFGFGLAGLLIFGSCKVDVPSDIGVTIDTKAVGTIIGKVIWDYNKDGIYTGVSGIDVSLDKPVQLYPKYKTVTASGGLFSFQEIPVGTYEVWANTITYQPYHYWRTKVGVTVTKQKVVDIGDLKLEIYAGSGY